MLICFSIYKSDKYKVGWRIKLWFSIELHGKDINLLNRIKSFFGVGSISIRKRDNQVLYTVSSLNDLINVIIPHFEQYPLITQKQADFASNM